MAEAIDLRVWKLRVCLAGLEDVVDLAAIMKGVVKVAGASKTSLIMSLGVIAVVVVE